MMFAATVVAAAVMPAPMVTATVMTAAVMAGTVMIAAMMITAVMIAAVVVTAVMIAAMVVIAVMIAAMVVIAVMIAAMMVAVVVTVVVIAVMIIAVAMAAAMMPAIPALAAAKAEAAPEFEANNIPAGAIPTVVVPAVPVAVPSELLIAPRRRRALPDIGSTCQVSGRVVRIGRFAVRSDVRIKLRQGQAGVLRLRPAFHDRRDAVHPKSAAGSDTAELEPRPLARCFDLFARRRGRLRGARERQHYQAREPEQARRDVANGMRTTKGHGFGFLAVHDTPTL
jgi:hypothetical protein